MTWVNGSQTRMMSGKHLARKTDMEIWRKSIKCYIGKTEISIKKKYIKKPKKEILETKSSISKMNSLYGLKGRFRQAKERNIKLEGRTRETIKSEEKKENWQKKTQ